MDENQATQYLSVLELLRKSSMLVRNFRDVSPFKSIKDKRLEENISFLKWLETWEQQSQLNPTENTTFCATTLFDIKSMIIGFQQLCKVIFKKYPGASIQGNKINTDVVENTFSQVRARNGQNDNPRLIEYGPTINNIIQGQTVSSRGNAGVPDPLCMTRRTPLRQSGNTAVPGPHTQSLNLPEINDTGC